MRKKVLFIVSDMESGGFQKSLVSLLQCFDYGRYDVDLLIFSPNGIFMNQIPSKVNIIKTNITDKFFSPFPGSIRLLLNDKDLMLAIKRCLIFFLSRFNKGIAAIYMSRLIPSLTKEYDVAIDYNGQYVLYYMIDKINAKRKISYFHSDYRKWSYYITADKKYYLKADYIVTISNICKQSLDEVFPVCSYKTKVIENISSPKMIYKMAEQNTIIKMDNEFINIVMVGRPSTVKGYDYALEACKILADEGYKIKWYAIGISNEIGKFKKAAQKMNIDREFIFVGETENPYSYIKQADIYAHPSRFEGKSVAIDEAKILHKPIVITNFTTANDHINNGIDGLIVNMDSTSLYKGIKMLIDDKSLRDSFVNNLRKQKLGNESEVSKLYELIDKEGENNNK